MINLNPELVLVIMLGGVVVLSVTGFPLAFCIGSLALVVGFLVAGDLAFNIIYTRFVTIITKYAIVAVPGFLFMGVILEEARVTDRLYSSLEICMGGLRGGLAVVTVLTGTLLATAVGIIGASVTMLTLVALPEMVKRGYSKELSCGSICAGGCLGILIPPSVMLVFYGTMAEMSVGKLFMAAFIPGFMLSGLYVTYILIRARVSPNVAPLAPAETRRGVSLGRKFRLLLTSVLPVAAIALAVLGTIFMGIATPTEAAGVGAVACLLLAVAYRRLTWSVLRAAALRTLKLVAMVKIVVGFAYAFVGIFFYAGCGFVLKEMLMAVPGGPYAVLAVILLVIFVLGFVIDWIGIIFIIVPVVMPIAPALGFDPFWLAIMICVTLQTAFMTPPVASAIYYCKGAADPALGIEISHIIRGCIPFVLIILFTLVLLAVFPQIALWLPEQMM